MAVQVDLQGNRSADTTTAIGGTQQRGTKTVLVTSTGAVIMVIVDANKANASLNWGDRTDVAKIEVWYSTNRTTWTRVANITPTSAIVSPYIYSADLFADNSIGIVWAGAAGLRYRKVTFGTWSVGTEQAIAATPSLATFEAIDTSVSDTGSILVAAAVSYSSGLVRGQYRMYAQRFGNATWINFGNYDMTVAATRSGGTAVACSWAKGTLGSGRRCWMVIYGGVNSTADQGFSAWMDSMDETVTPVSNTRVQAFSGTSAGTLSKDGGWSQRVRTCQIAPTAEDNTFLFGGGSVQSVPSFFAGKMSFSGTTVTTVLPLQSASNVSGRAKSGISTVAITIGQDAVNFLANVNTGFFFGSIFGAVDPNATQPLSWTATVKKDKTGFVILGHNYFNNQSLSTRETVMLFGGGGRNARTAKSHDMAYSKAGSTSGSSGGTILYSQYAVAPLLPPASSPTAGSTVSSSTPPLSVSADLDRAYPQAHLKAVFQFAKDAAFTTNLRSFTQEDSKFTQVFGTEKAGAIVRLTDVLPPLYELSQGNWYMRVALRDAFNQLGNYNTNSTPFNVSHPPSAAELSPSGDAMIAYTAGQVHFTWTFTDPSSTDYQTAFQVIVYDNSNDSIVHDSGKVASANSDYITSIASSAKEKVLKWTVKLWDKDDVSGPASSPQTFYLADSPVVNITSPTTNQVLATGIPKVTFNATTGGGRKITKYIATWTKNGLPVHTSGIVNLSAQVASGVDITYQAPGPVFKNLTNYSVQVVATDEFGLEGTSSIVPLSTSFVIPAGPSSATVSTSQYNTEGGGYVEVSWPDTGRDADFQAWVVYRKDDMFDPSTGVVISAGEYEAVGYMYEVASTYSFKDYYAPSGYRCSYLVKQMVNRFGDVVESANTAAQIVFPHSEGYWLIQHDEETGETRDVVRLYNVVSEDYVLEIEEAEYSIIGRGRHVDRGDILGVKGTLVAQIRDSAGKSARQRKFELENIQEENTSLYIRNPFGDVYKSYIGSLQFSRIAGVGTSEFVDVTIPYSEVY